MPTALVRAVVARIEEESGKVARSLAEVFRSYQQSLEGAAEATSRHLEVQQRAAQGVEADSVAAAAAADALVAQSQRLRARRGEVEHLAERARELREAVDALEKFV